MEDRNVIGGAMAVGLSAVADFYAALGPYILLALILIVVDFRFGVARTKVKLREKIKAGQEIKDEDKFRPSRAVRRSLNKVVDYICWVTLAGVFGSSFGTLFGIPMLSGCILLIIYGIELNSCYNNYFEVRGIKKKFNIFKLFKNKLDINIDECIEEKNNETTGNTTTA
jgi:hypothetical protein